MRSLISVGAAFLLAAAAPLAQGAAEGDATWNYSPTSDNGPQNWDKVHADCKKNEQSPINIGAVDVDTTLRPLNRQWAKKTILKGAKLSNDGHAVKMSFTGTEGQEKLKLTDPNQNGKEYTMAQFHFHAPSEHTSAAPCATWRSTWSTRPRTAPTWCWASPSSPARTAPATS